jgi:hypothetical protein
VKAPVKTGMEVVVKVHYVVRRSEPLRSLGGCSSFRGCSSRRGTYYTPQEEVPTLSPEVCHRDWSEYGRQHASALLTRGRSRMSVVPHVRICAGGTRRRVPLPRR